MSEILTPTEAIEIARAHINNNRRLRESAVSRLIEAEECAKVGHDIDALYWAAFSLSYSVGFQNDSYKRVRAALDALRAKHWNKS